MKQGVDIDERSGPNNDTALLLASKFDHPTVVRHLLSEGASVDAVNSDGQTALFWAVLRNNTEAARALVTLGRADLELRYEYLGESATVLHVASVEGYLRLVRMLAFFGADVSARTEEKGLTALNVASFHGYLDIVKYLFIRRADISTLDSEGYAPIYVAAQVGTTGLAFYLDPHGPL